MRAGTLRSRVAILTPPSAESPQDANGQPTAAWTTAATVWGDLEEQGTAGTTFQDDQFNTANQVTITIRYYSGLTTKHRLQIGSRLFHILHVGGDLQRRVDMVCACVELVT